MSVPDSCLVTKFLSLLATDYKNDYKTCAMDYLWTLKKFIANSMFFAYSGFFALVCVSCDDYSELTEWIFFNLDVWHVRRRCSTWLMFSSKWPTLQDRVSSLWNVPATMARRGSRGSTSLIHPATVKLSLVRPGTAPPSHETTQSFVLRITPRLFLSKVVR